MTLWWLIIILATLALLGVAFLWLALKINTLADYLNPKNRALDGAAEQDVEHLFDKQFREELRNRGRMHFEKIIGENAVFLQQDLRLTTGQLNDYMKNEITQKLKTEFDRYEKSIMDANAIAMDSIKKTNEAVDEQREIITQEVQKQILVEKKKIIDKFEANMSDIINHYVLDAIGNQVDLNNQLEFILSELEANKKAMIEDINNGA
jgi:hypothetical protein